MAPESEPANVAGGPASRITTLVWKECPQNPVVLEQVLLRTQALRRHGLDAGSVFGGCTPDGVPREALADARFENRTSIVSLARLALSEIRGRDRAAILICRGPLVTALAALLRRFAGRNARVVYDARSWYVGESRERGVEGPLRRLAKRLVEGLAYRRADHSVLVSQALVGIALSHGADPSKLTVIPQYVPDPVKADISHVPPAEVIYVATAALPYQPRDSIARLLESLADELPDVRFGWLDGASVEDEPVFVRDNLWRVRVPPESVFAVLERAHAGLIIRPPGLSNATAAPTKVAQYLSAGCAIVTAPTTPSAAEAALLHGGEVVSDPESPRSWAHAVADTLARPRPGAEGGGRRVIEQWAAVIERAAR
jgi:Glycosyl transferase 4-like domain